MLKLDQTAMTIGLDSIDVTTSAYANMDCHIKLDPHIIEIEVFTPLSQRTRFTRISFHNSQRCLLLFSLSTSLSLYHWLVLILFIRYSDVHGGLLLNELLGQVCAYRVVCHTFLSVVEVSTPWRLGATPSILL